MAYRREQGITMRPCNEHAWSMCSAGTLWPHKSFGMCRVACIMGKQSIMAQVSPVKGVCKVLFESNSWVHGGAW